MKERENQSVKTPQELKELIGEIDRYVTEAVVAQLKRLNRKVTYKDIFGMNLLIFDKYVSVELTRDGDARFELGGGFPPRLLSFLLADDVITPFDVILLLERLIAIEK